MGPFVIRSGDGFLFNPYTLSMIRHSTKPRIAAKRARRYQCAEDAEDDLARVRRHGFVARLELLSVACERGGS